MKKFTFRGRISIKKEKIKEQDARMGLLILLRGRSAIKKRSEVGGVSLIVQLGEALTENLQEKLVEYCGSSKAI